MLFGKTTFLYFSITLYKKQFLHSSGFFASFDYILGTEFKSVFSFSLLCQVLEIQRYKFDINIVEAKEDLFIDLA